jgi:hypothetical protein
MFFYIFHDDNNVELEMSEYLATSNRNETNI